MHRKTAHSRAETLHLSYGSVQKVLDELGAQEVHEGGAHHFSVHDLNFNGETRRFPHMEIGLTVKCPALPLQRNMRLRAYGGRETSIVTLSVEAHWNTEDFYTALVEIKTANETVHVSTGPLGHGAVSAYDHQQKGISVESISSPQVRTLVKELVHPAKKSIAWQRICEEIRG